MPSMPALVPVRASAALGRVRRRAREEEAQQLDPSVLSLIDELKRKQPDPATCWQLFHDILDAGGIVACERGRPLGRKSAGGSGVDGGEEGVERDKPSSSSTAPSGTLPAPSRPGTK
jgi:hypothetical protein